MHAWNFIIRQHNVFKQSGSYLKCMLDIYRSLSESQLEPLANGLHIQLAIYMHQVQYQV